MSETTTKTNIFKNVSLWGAVLTLAYLIIKNWLGIEIPGWNDIYAQIIAILTIVLG